MKMKTAIVLITLSALAVFSFTLYQGLFVSHSDSEIATSAYKVSVASMLNYATSSLPLRLIIPSLHIDAKVQHVGITKKGNIGIPTNFSDVGWYKFGPVPGNSGSAIIDGHLDNALSLPGVFKHLNAVKIGDVVIVINGYHQAVHFSVRKISLFDYNASSFATQEVFLSDKKLPPRLNLITCEGDWYQAIHSYSKRLVVFTELSQNH